MFRFLAAVAAAIARLIMAPINAIAALLDSLFGGGSAAPASPIPHLEAALPDEGRIDEARDLERGKAAAADVILKQSPVMQVKTFASMSDEDRLQADLTLLREDQIGWLLNLNDRQLRAVAVSSDRRIEAALNGEANALTAIPSVGQAKADDGAWLANRLESKRAVTLATTPSQTIGYAVH
ncbi:hypothetical protein [Rhizobium leguminosarum]|jgi:hypothetical protein|uniref:hypothetical protein n=1 Tax=Rhizobium leguminosarum TaxID=384 RepID=UPI0013B70F8A|nr:hypothetical protein [Rhizobium leguminosarum]NEI65047.1 hypothetical protein [Rhizobium leguminosarum]NZD51874.1 hypothetical protein [Rhizobium leguminosarum]